MKKCEQIIYYEISNLFYSLYYIDGFIKNSKKFGYEFIISKEIPPLNLNTTGIEDWKQILYAVCLFKIRQEDEEFFFCIDAFDSNDRNPDKGMGYNIQILEKVRYYFKVNYELTAINSDPNLKKFAHKIYPAYPPCPIKLENRINNIQIMYNKNLINRNSLFEFARKVKYFYSTYSLHDLIKLRSKKKTVDIFFVLTYYHNKIHSDDNEYRYQIMKEIQKNKRINSIVGFVSDQKLQGKYASLQLQKYPMKNHLMNLAGSKIGIYVRGVHDCISFKFVQMLCFGMPIKGQTIVNNRTKLMENKYFEEQFSFNQPKDIVQQAIELMDNKDRYEEICKVNRETFDNKFSPEVITAEILVCIQ